MFDICNLHPLFGDYSEVCKHVWINFLLPTYCIMERQIQKNFPSHLNLHPLRYLKPHRALKKYSIKLLPLNRTV